MLYSNDKARTCFATAQLRMRVLYDAAAFTALRWGVPCGERLQVF